MEYFHYKVKDQKGQELEGTISSVDQQKATEALQARGFKVLNIVSRSQATTGHPIVNQPAAKVPMPAMPTYGLYQYKGTDKQRYFILGQMSELLRAGVNPAQGFVTLGQNQGNVGFRKSLEEMAATSTAGGSISEVMRKYPRLYSEHVIGMTQAGEYGGFLPEALDVASKQAKEAHVFKIWHWFVWLILVLFFVIIPITLLAGHSFNATFRKTWNGGGGEAVTSNTVVRDMWADVGQMIKWPIGPYFLLVLGIVVGTLLWLNSDKQKRFRHRLGLRYPSLKKRAKMECFSIFTWAASRLSRAGVSPNSTWEMSCNCIPNIEMREQMKSAGWQMNEGSKITDAVRNARMLPDEYISLLSTAELTGTIPGTFERLSNVARGDYEAQTAKAKMWGCALGCFWLGVIGPIGLTIIIYFYYDILNVLLKEING